MKDKWYADNRDLIKWAVLFHLAETYGAQCILQLAFYRPTRFDKIVIDIDSKPHAIPAEVIKHFRDIQAIKGIQSKARVEVLSAVLTDDRGAYLQAVHAFLSKFSQEQCIVFVNPDTGLEPRKATLKHVLNDEAREIWKSLKNNDVFVFYQHKTNRSGKPWINEKQEQLAKALQVQGSSNSIKSAKALEFVKDVVFFYIQKP